MEGFLERTGRLETGRAIYALVAQAARRHEEQRPALAVQMSALLLAINGYTPDDLARVKRSGLDLAELAAKNPTRIEPREKAALSEAVVIVEVADIRNTLEPGDGFRSSVVLDVKEVLKGTLPARITLRRLTGPGPQGHYRSTDFDGSIGETHLLFLSNGLYRYHVQFPEAAAAPIRQDISEAELDRNYITVFMPIWMDYLSADMIEEIRSTGRLIDSALH